MYGWIDRVILKMTYVLGMNFSWWNCEELGNFIWNSTDFWIYWKWIFKDGKDLKLFKLYGASIIDQSIDVRGWS